MSEISKAPVLPVELQNRILTYFDTPSEEDLVFLWTTVRNVSTTFRAIVDGMVLNRHLKHTSIHYDFGLCYLDSGKAFMETDFTFKQISSENPEVVIFRAKVAKKYKKDMKDVLRSHTIHYQKEVKEPPHFGILKPPHSVIIRRSVNDTELPDLSIDYDAFELSCNWKGMLTAFCYEKKLEETYMDRWKENANKNKEEITRKPGMSEILKMAKSMLKAMNDYKKKARRSRINRQYARVREELKMKGGKGENNADNDECEEDTNEDDKSNEDDDDWEEEADEAEDEKVMVSMDIGEDSEEDSEEEEILKRMNDLAVGLDHAKFSDPELSSGSDGEDW